MSWLMTGWSDKRKREGVETSIIGNDKWEADKTTTASVVPNKRDTVVVAGGEGPWFEYERYKEEGMALQQWGRGGGFVTK